MIRKFAEVLAYAALCYLLLLAAMFIAHHILHGVNPFVVALEIPALLIFLWLAVCCGGAAWINGGQLLWEIECWWTDRRRK